MSALQAFLYTKPGCFCAAIWTGLFVAYASVQFAEALRQTGLRLHLRAVYGAVLCLISFLPLVFY